MLTVRNGKFVEIADGWPERSREADCLSAGWNIEAPRYDKTLVVCTYNPEDPETLNDLRAGWFHDCKHCIIALIAWCKLKGMWDCRMSAGSIFQEAFPDSGLDPWSCTYREYLNFLRQEMYLPDWEE